MISAALVALAVAAAGVGWFVRRSGEAENDAGRRRITSGDVVMLGDSITALGDWATLLPGRQIANAGRPGYTTAQLVPIAAEVAAARPRAVFVLTGTNDIRDALAPEWTAEQLRLLLDAFTASSDTVVVIQTVLPRADAVEQVRATNAAIAVVAAERGIELLDLYQSFDDGRGGLQVGETDDGIHLTRAGYDRWADILGGALERLDV